MASTWTTDVDFREEGTGKGKLEEVDFEGGDIFFCNPWLSHTNPSPIDRGPEPLHMIRTRQAAREAKTQSVV